MGMFLVGLLTGVFLGVLGRDIWRYLTFYLLLGIAARQERQERKKAIKDLEDHINKE